MEQIRILMVDDHSLFRESLCRLLQSAPGIDVVGQCSTVDEAIARSSQCTSDVVLLDYDLGEELGSSRFTELKNHLRDARVLMVTAGMPDSAAAGIMEAGASGILLKHSSTDQLLAAIHQVAKGEIWIDTGAVRALVNARTAQTERVDSKRPLTSRQRDVLRGILDGLANKEIAWKLKASESSIKAVIQELFHKAGVRTRSQLVRIAIERHSADWLQSEEDE